MTRICIIKYHSICTVRYIFIYIIYPHRCNQKFDGSCFFLMTPRCLHDDVIKWKHFPRNWPFVRGIHRSPVNSPHKGQRRGALMFPLIWINGGVNNRKAGDLRRYRTHYDVIVMAYPHAVGRVIIKIPSSRSTIDILVSRPSYLCNENPYSSYDVFELKRDQLMTTLHLIYFKNIFTKTLMFRWLQFSTSKTEQNDQHFCKRNFRMHFLFFA